MNILLCTLNARFFHVSLALHSLRSNQPEKSKHPVLVKEYTINQEFKDIVGDIMLAKPDIIGFGVYIWNKSLIFRLARVIKKINPSIRIILGGPEVSYDPEEFLKEEPWIDAIVLGEGEESFWKYVASITEENSSPILGVAQKNDVDKAHWQYQEIKNLDQLKFAYEKTPDSEIANRISYYESSRGCPFSCSYCLSGLDGKVRNRNTELVKAELDRLIAKKVKQVKFVDRTFNADPHHFKEIISYLVQVKESLNFHFEMDASILSDNTVEELSKLPEGRVQLEIGIQSTNTKVLQAVGRHSAFKKESEIIRKLRNETSIHLHLDLIAGLPYEDLSIFENSFNDVFALGPHQLQLGFLKMLRGSRIRSEAEHYNYVYDEDAPYEVISNSWLSASEMHRLRMIEHCLEEVWNAGRFHKTFNFLIEKVYQNNPFQCFGELSTLLDNSENLLVGRNGKWWAKKIYEEIQKKEEWKSNQEILLDLLKWDILIMEQGKWKPDFIHWQSRNRDDFWRREEEVRKYIPGYHFVSWREIQRTYLIEKFSSSLFEDKESEIMIQLEEPFTWKKIKE